MMRSIALGSFSRRLMISSVISAATLTPMSTISQANPGLAEAGEQPFQPRLGQMAGEKDQPLSPRPSQTSGSLALADRRLQVGERLDHLRALEALQPFGVFEVDPARIDLHQAVRRHGFEFRRGVAGKDDRRHAAFAGLGEDIGGKRVGNAAARIWRPCSNVAGATTTVW